MSPFVYVAAATTLLGVIGLLYGLLERAKRQAAEEKADTISKSLLDQITEREHDHDKNEQVVSVYKAEIDRLLRLIDATKLTVDDLRHLLNDTLSWRVPAPSGGGKPEPVPTKPASGNAPGDSG